MTYNVFGGTINVTQSMVWFVSITSVTRVRIVCCQESTVIVIDADDQLDDLIYNPDIAVGQWFSSVCARQLC